MERRNQYLGEGWALWWCYICMYCLICIFSVAYFSPCFIILVPIALTSLCTLPYNCCIHFYKVHSNYQEVNHYDFHIVYSASYRVPVLYFHAYHNGMFPFPFSYKACVICGKYLIEFETVFVLKVWDNWNTGQSYAYFVEWSYFFTIDLLYLNMMGINIRGDMGNPHDT